MAAQLRDPSPFYDVHTGDLWLYYVGRGERSIEVARLELVGCDTIDRQERVRRSSRFLGAMGFPPLAVARGRRAHGR